MNLHGILSPKILKKIFERLHPDPHKIYSCGMRIRIPATLPRGVDPHLHHMRLNTYSPDQKDTDLYPGRQQGTPEYLKPKI